MMLTPPGVAILNTVLARQLWPDGDAIGRRLQVLDQGGRRVTVVGIVQRTTQQFPGERPQPAIFFPYEQQPRGQMVLLAHTDGPSASVLDALRAVARRPDPSVPVFDAQTIERFYYVLVEAQFGTVVRMIGGIGLMGMALTMVGLVRAGVVRREPANAGDRDPHGGWRDAWQRRPHGASSVHVSGVAGTAARPRAERGRVVRAGRAWCPPTSE